jgi:hypothetical protein
MSLKLEMNVEVIVSTSDGGINIEDDNLSVSIEYDHEFHTVMLSGLSEKGALTLEQLNKLVTGMEYVTNNQ